jgi:hypothetical protein
MRGGDISNEIPFRVLVTLDCILDRRPKITKVLGIPVTSEEVTYNRQALSQFWRFAEKYSFRLELVGFEYSQEEMDGVLEDLDNLGTNPFNYSRAYNVVADLVAELPYRPEVKNVIDIPERGLRYGHWYLDLGALINGSR